VAQASSLCYRRLKPAPTCLFFHLQRQCKILAGTCCKGTAGCALKTIDGHGSPCRYEPKLPLSLLQNCFFVILNEVKDLNLLKIRDSSLRSE
jgi:hypothetical protein